MRRAVQKEPLCQRPRPQVAPVAIEAWMVVDRHVDGFLLWPLDSPGLVEAEPMLRPFYHGLLSRFARAGRKIEEIAVDLRTAPKWLLMTKPLDLSALGLRGAPREQAESLFNARLPGRLTVVFSELVDASFNVITLCRLSAGAAERS
jgi:hypothetical protein